MIFSAIEEKRHELENVEENIKFYDVNIDLFREQFDDFINAIYETVIIGDFKADPATVLKECDPVSYNEQLKEYVNELDIDMKKQVDEGLADLYEQKEELEEEIEDLLEDFDEEYA